MIYLYTYAVFIRECGCVYYTIVGKSNDYVKTLAKLQNILRETRLKNSNIVSVTYLKCEGIYDLKKMLDNDYIPGYGYIGNVIT